MKNKLSTILSVILIACAAFGACVTATSSSEPSPATDIVAHNLSLNESVYIIYFVDFQNVPSGAEKGVLIWTSAQDEYLYGAETAKITNIRGTVSGYSTYAFTGVSAKMMSQDIYAKSYVKVGDDITYGPLDKYSVLQYAYNKKGSTTMVKGGTIQLGELLVDLLDYGTSAQKYFGYNLDRLANEEYYQIRTVNGTLPDGTTSGLYKSGEQVTLTADSDDANCWEKSSGAKVGVNKTLTVTVTGDETYTASHVDNNEPIIIVWDGTTAPSFAGGSGTEEDPYLISTPEQFAYFAERNNTEKPTGEYYKLTADLYFNLGDASEWENDFEGNDATGIILGPVCNDGSAFAGTFDGDGYTISGFYGKRTSSDTMGIFGSTTKGQSATIKNLVVTNSYFESAGAIGAVVGQTGGGTTTLSNIFVTDSVYIVSSGNYAGGIVGHNGNNGYGEPTLNIDNCVNGATVRASAACVGGILGNGNQKPVHVSNCLNYGSISGNQYVSGIIGLGNYKNITISYSVNIGALSGSSPYQITFSGNSSHKPTVSNSFAISGNFGNSNVITSDCVVTTKSAFISEGFLNSAGAVLAGDWTELAHAQVVDGVLQSVKEICVPKSLADALRSEISTSCYDVQDEYSDAPEWILNGLSAGTVTITNTSQYKEFAEYFNSQSFNFAGKTLALGADLTFNTGNSSNWSSSAPSNDMTDYIIGDYSHSFNGTFDGNGHTISGFYAKKSGELGVGLFGGTSSANIINFTLQNSYFEAAGDAAAVLASAVSSTTRINTVYVKDSVEVVSKGNNAGGMVASVNSVVYIENCLNAATVSSTGLYVGGIVGNGNGNNLNISHCLNKGAISSTNSGNAYVGGIIGKNDYARNIVTDTLNTGIATASNTNYAAGILGSVDGGNSSFTNVYSAYIKWYGRSGSTANWTYKNCAYIEDSIIGMDAYYNMLLDFDGYWTVVDGDDPTLISFADTVIDTPDRDIYAEEDPYILDWDEIPSFSYGTLKNDYKVGEAKYDVDSFARRYTGTTYDNFSAYLSYLGSNGYTCHATNDINGECCQATYYNDDYTVNVVYYNATGETFVTAEQRGTLSELQIAPKYQTVSYETKYISPRLAQFGECDIFTLANGHFIIIDSAQPSNAELLIETLEEYADGETPVVDAWFFTHAHVDHIGACMEIGSNPDLVERVIVNGFYYSWPVDAGFRKESDYVDFMESMAKFYPDLDNFRDEDGDVTQRYKLHAGMAFYIQEITVDILMTQDQVMPSDYTGGFNDSSTAYKLTIHSKHGSETTFLILGDAHNGVCNRLMAKYSYDVLHPEFFTSLHHGGNDCTSFFQFIAPDYLIYTNGGTKSSTGYKWLHDNCLGYVTNGIEIAIRDDYDYDFTKINSAATIHIN